MALNSFDRNYGASLTSREYWGGNNGFITVALTVDAAKELVFPGMAVYEAADPATEAGATLRQNAQRNFFKITEMLATRGVMVVTSVPAEYTTTTEFATLEALKTAGEAKATFLQSAEAGTTSIAPTAAPIYHITFMVERANVFTSDTTKYGRVGASNPQLYAVHPLTEIVNDLQSADLFESTTSETQPDGSGGTLVQAQGVVAYALDSLPAI